MTAATLTLTEFLLARIAEDEAAAVEARDLQDYMPSGAWNLARVLAECAAKRAVVEEARSYSPELEHGDNGEWAFEAVLRHLAAVYSDHPDYRAEWA